MYMKEILQQYWEQYVLFLHLLAQYDYFKVFRKYIRKRRIELYFKKVTNVEIFGKNLVRVGFCLSQGKLNNRLKENKSQATANMTCQIIRNNLWH